MRRLQETLIATTFVSRFAIHCEAYVSSILDAKVDAPENENVRLEGAHVSGIVTNIAIVRDIKQTVESKGPFRKA